MCAMSLEEVQDRLVERKRELQARLDRVKQNHRRTLNADSGEQATEAENIEVVDALGNDAKAELAQITEALHRVEIGTYGTCVECRQAIPSQRLDAQPYAVLCIDCARDVEN